MRRTSHKEGDTTVQQSKRGWIAGLVVAGAVIAAVGWPALADVWRVPEDFLTVNAAVNSDKVVAGDTIQLVDAGEESFPIELGKAGLTLECADSEAAILQVPPGHVGVVVRANGVVVRGCTITSLSNDPAQQGAAGIVVKEVTQGVVIEETAIYNLFSGIRLLGASGVTLRGNRLWDIGPLSEGRRTGIALFLEGSRGNTLQDNRVLRGDLLPGPFAPLAAGNRNHCGEGLLLFLSDDNRVEGDLYAGCTTNGVTLFGSRGNVLENMTVTDNGSWGVAFVLSDGNALNNSEITRNRRGGVKLEGAQNNRVSDPERRGNNVHDNGDGQGEDIQILVTSGESVLFTAPDIFFNGNRPDDPLATEPTDVRGEKRAVREMIERLALKVAELGTELKDLRDLVKAEVGILFELSDELSQAEPDAEKIQEEQDRLASKQEEIARAKTILLACKIGAFSVGGGGELSFQELPDWEKEFIGDRDEDNDIDNVDAQIFCMEQLDSWAPSGSVFRRDTDPQDLDQDGDEGEPSFANLETELAELQTELLRLKDKIRLLTQQGIIAGPCNQDTRQPDDCFELLQKLDTLIGDVRANVEAKLKDVAWQLLVADHLLPTPAEIAACLDQQDPEASVRCVDELLQKRFPPGTLTFPNLGVLDPRGDLISAVKTEVFHEGDAWPSLIAASTFIVGDNLLEVAEELAVDEIAPAVVGRVDENDRVTKTLTVRNLTSDRSVRVRIEVGYIGEWDNIAGSCDGLDQTLDPGASVECTIEATIVDVVDEDSDSNKCWEDPDEPCDVLTITEAILASSPVEVIPPPSATDAKLWIEAALEEVQRIPADVESLLLWLNEFEAELPAPPFAVNCVSLFKEQQADGTFAVTPEGTAEGIGCLLGAKLQGGNSLSGLGRDELTVFFGVSDFQARCEAILNENDETDAAIKCAQLVDALAGDPQAQEFLRLFELAENGGTWSASHLEAHKIGGNRRESTGNVIANNVLTTSVAAPGCNIPERHPVLGSVARGECSIGIKIESPENLILHNWLTNEDVFPTAVDGDPTARGELAGGRRMLVGIVVLANDNVFLLNTCEEVNVCVIKGGNDDREDVEHEYLFRQLAITQCGDATDPTACTAPEEKILILEVAEEAISVSKPDDKCSEKLSAVRPAQVRCAQSADETFQSVRVLRANFFLNLFEKRKALDIIDAESDTYAGNLFLESGIEIRQGVDALTESFENNDFKDAAFSNAVENALINLGANWAKNLTVRNGSDPGAGKAFCTQENFGAEQSFTNAKRFFSDPGKFNVTLYHYFGTTTVPLEDGTELVTGNLPPNLSFLPDLTRAADETTSPSATVEPPEGKPRTCLEAVEEGVPASSDKEPTPTPVNFSQAIESLQAEATNARRSCPNVRIRILDTLRGGSQAIAEAVQELAACEAAVRKLNESAITALNQIGEVPMTRQSLVSNILNILRQRSELVLQGIPSCRTELENMAGGPTLDRRLISAALRACVRPSVLGQTLAPLADRLGLLLQAAGIGSVQVEALAVERMTLAQHGSVYTLRVEGQGITEARLEVYDVSGRAVFRHQAVADRAGRSLSLMFAGLSEEGQRLANGVYLAVVTVTGLDGQQVRRIQKLIVLR